MNKRNKRGKKALIGGVLVLAAAVAAGRFYSNGEVFPQFQAVFWNLDTEESWDTDPAYRIYQQNRDYYREYEYMLRAGEEGLEISMEEQSSETPSLADGTLLSEGSSASESSLASETGLEAGTVVPAAEALEKPPAHLPAQLADYDYLMKYFYNIHSSTTAGRELMSAERFLNRDFALPEQAGPQILIYHTHSQETFADYGPERPDANIVTVGEALAEHLREKGYEVIHDTTVYDLKNGELDRSKAYTYALEGITAILQENPSIQVILDIHRDGVKEGVRLTWEYEGQPAAQIMFFHGISRTPEGPIEYLANPYVEDNMAFSFQMQLDAAVNYPGLTRKIYLKGLRYNMHLRPRSSLIEVGAQTNTVDEALRAMGPLAQLLDKVLQGK